MLRGPDECCDAIGTPMVCTISREGGLRGWVKKVS